MSIYDRSAQFAPFAALVGYDESINEAGRIVDSKINLGIDKIEEISRILALLYQNASEDNKVNITYFLKDSSKKGGKYISTTSTVKKVIPNEKILILNQKDKIRFEDIIELTII